MAHAIESRANTPVDALRDKLSEIERASVKPSAESVEALLLALDDAEQRIDSLGQQGIEIRSEEARWEQICNRLSSRPGLIANAARGNLAILRLKHPNTQSFWWHSDIEQSKRFRQSLTRSVTTLLIVVGVLFSGWQLVNIFFPPDPIAVLTLEANSRIEDFAQQLDWQAALAVVDETLPNAPDEPDLLVWGIVLAKKLNDTQRFDHDVKKAEKILADRLPELWVQIGQRYLQLNDIAEAEAAANHALELAPLSAQAHLLLASVAEMRGDVAKAIAYFDKTYELAEGDPQLQVIARIRMGQLMQQPIFPAETTTRETSTVEP